MRKSKNPSDNFEQSLKQIEIVLEEVRPELESRLQKLTNSYHNKQHAKEVVQATQSLLSNLVNPDLLSDTEKLLLVECAWRHDDGHSGSTYRQEMVNDGLSNEEYAEALLEQDLQGRLDEESLQFMKDNILAISFGQDDAFKLPAGKQHYFRSYKPKTDWQKLLALADVSGFTKGWDGWVDEGWRLLEESPQSALFDIDAWLAYEEEFVNFYISPLLDSVGLLLKPGYLKQLQQGLDILRRELASLKDKSNPKRAEYDHRLKAIREAHFLPEDRQLKESGSGQSGRG